jgi:type IV secretion system protein VirD4
MNNQVKFWLVVAFILFLLFIYLEIKKAGLNRFNSKRVGHGQHGTAQWADKKEIKSTYIKIKYLPKRWRYERESRNNLKQGLVIGLKGKRSLVDTTDTNTILIGPAGIGKTFFYLIPQIEYAAATSSSFVVTDTKGQTHMAMAEILEKFYGYKVVLIDLRNPQYSEGYNLMHLVNKYMDLYKKNREENQVLSKQYEAKAQKYAKIIAKSIMETAQIKVGDTYFYDNAEGLLTSSILLISEFAEKDERHIVSVFRLIKDLAGNSNKNKNINKSKFKELIELLPSDHKTRWFTGGALDSHMKVTLSIFSTSLSKLLRFIDSELEQIICFDNNLFSAESFSKEKTAVFFTLPEEDTTKHFLFSLFMIQLYRELLTIADTLPTKSFENRIYFFMDEFGTLPAIENVEMVFSASRSRNIFSLPIIQSISQLQDHYGKERTEIILDNCQNTVFSGFSPTSQTAEYLSKAMGTYTARSGSISKGKGHERKITVTEQMIERPLMSADEIKRIRKGTFIYLKTGKNPLMTKIPLFKKWGITLSNDCLLIEKKLEEVKYVEVIELRKNIMSYYGIKEEEKIKEVETVETNISLDKKEKEESYNESNEEDVIDNMYDF